MTLIPCPYLNAQVELTDERRHILEKHPDLLPGHLAWIAGAVAEPDEVRRDQRGSFGILVIESGGEAALGCQEPLT